MNKVSQKCSGLKDHRYHWELYKYPGAETPPEICMHPPIHASDLHASPGELEEEPAPRVVSSVKATRAHSVQAMKEGI